MCNRRDGKTGIELGTSMGICLTDHYDMDYIFVKFQLDTPAYAAKSLMNCRKNIAAESISIRFGTHGSAFAFANGWPVKPKCGRHPFDYVIGSMHVIDGKPRIIIDAFPDWTWRRCTGRIFGPTAENIRSSNFPERHLDYVVGSAEKKSLRLQLPRICGRDRYHFKRQGS